MTASGQLIPIVAVSLTIFFHIVSSFAEKAPYTSFAKNATSAPATGYYDYIIIGGGTAGCPLAATLSASAKVLLLERGGLPYDNPNITHLNGFTNSLEDSSDTSPAQLFISTDGVFNHRGRVLGGGSGINAGFFSRASTEYVLQVGWDPKLVNESYAWVDRKMVFQPRLSTWQAAVRGGLLEAGVLPDNGFTFEHLVGTKTGGSIFDENGTRHTSADLLEYADPTNIIVYLHATAHQILFKTSPRQKDKAYGVVFRDSNHTAYLKNALKNEIILSAGAIGSPQLLMLSGIGPGTKLKSLGIDVVLNQPNEYLGRKLLGTSLVQVAGITDFGVFFEAGSGLMTSLFRTPQSPSSKDVGIVLQKVSGPFSTGYTELVSNVNPNVTFNYYNDSRDLQKCIRGMKIMQRVIESQSLSEYRYNNTSFESLRRYVLAHPINFRKKHDSAASNSDQYCKDTVMTIWHYHGGCHVNRVVDHDYRVIGLDSIFNYSPGTNPQATLMMLGRYMGRKILQQRPTVK